VMFEVLDSAADFINHSRELPQRGTILRDRGAFNGDLRDEIVALPHQR